jgi:hypothetical protein
MDQQGFLTLPMNRNIPKDRLVFVIHLPPEVRLP